MVRSLPPLNWVRVFEAAARHQNFLRASHELGVSAGAISQQVKALEDRLGVRLFERLPRGVRLTDSGSRYRDALGPALDAIDQASKRVSEEKDTAILRVAALPAIAERWLTPRLARLQAILKNVAVQVVTVETIAQAVRQHFDVAIHYEAEIADGFSYIPLFQDSISPVCSPAFVRDHALHDPKDVSNCRLLYDTKWTDDWSNWLGAANLPDRRLDREFGFSLYSMAVEAAIEGQGILMGHQALISRELAAGRLVAPFDLAIPAPHRYVAMFAEDDAARTPVAEFLHWLQDEARAQE